MHAASGSARTRNRSHGALRAVSRLPGRPEVDITEALAAVNELLGERRTPLGVRPAVREPDVRRTLEIIEDRLRALSHTGNDPGPRDAATRTVLAGHRWLTSARLTAPTLEQGWALADALRDIWIRHASVDELAAYELKHPSGLPDDAPLPRRRQQVLHGQQRRRDEGLRERTRMALRASYLRRIGRLLLGLVLTTGAVAVLVADDAGGVVLTAAAGAVGGALSGARSLRDAVDAGRARSFRAWWWVQPTVGAAVGLFTYALLRSTLLTLPGSTSTDDAVRTSAFVVYAFAAGFSEPFFLGVMAKISGSADAAAEAHINPGAPGRAGTRDGAPR